jgi:ATP-dependent exoDNAse (exonuclease V) alpha subunit
MHRLLLEARQEGGLPHGSLLVIDETSMAETRVLAPLLRLVDEAGGKAILVGDPGQLPAVGAGGLFAVLCGQLGALELTQNRRQLDAQERAALARLRLGDPEPCLAHAAASGRLQVEHDATAGKHRLLQDWWKAAAVDPARTIMLAHRRQDVRDLNDAARVLMRESGQLGAEALTLGGREFRAGDRILCRRNDSRLGVRNGMRGTVVDLDRTTRTLTLETVAGAWRRIPLDYAAEHLDHAYALTGHAAQGATVDRAFVLLRDEGALREWGYVACSRARMETRLYLVGDALEPEHHGRPVDARDPTTRLAGALERPAAEQAALMQRRDTSDVTRRALEQRRRASERALELAERRLATAEEKVRGLGRFGRRRGRLELQAEVSLQRTAVRLARRQLACMPLEPPERRPVPTLRPSLERARPALGRVRELDRGRGIEL